MKSDARVPSHVQAEERDATYTLMTSSRFLSSISLLDIWSGSLNHLMRRCSAMAFPATRSALSQETSMREPEIFAPRSASAWAQQLQVGVDTFFLPNCKHPARSTPTFSESSELHNYLIGVEYHSHFIPLPLFIHCIPKPPH